MYVQEMFEMTSQTPLQKTVLKIPQSLKPPCLIFTRLGGGRFKSLNT